jgi:hypothetical protein
MTSSDKFSIANLLGVLLAFSHLSNKRGMIPNLVGIESWAVEADKKERKGDTVIGANHQGFLFRLMLQVVCFGQNFRRLDSTCSVFWKLV